MRKFIYNDDGLVLGSDNDTTSASPTSPTDSVTSSDTSPASPGPPDASSGPSSPGADQFIAACEGDVGSRLEAHCNCIEGAVAGTVSQSAINRELSNIRAGNPPAWFMQAAINCPS